MRYQAVVLQSEIGGALEIGSIAFAMYDSGGPGLSSYDDFEICMGLTDRDTLGASFQGNYIAGTRMVVLEDDQLQISALPDGEIHFTLDEPFPYPGVHNLIVEVAYSACSEEGSRIMSWHWGTAGRREVAGRYTSSGGTMYYDLAPWLVLEDVSGFPAVTWGCLKRSAAPPGRP